MTERDQLCREIEEFREDLIDLCARMVQIPSETPPSDTRALAAFLQEILKQIPGMKVACHTKEEPVRNLTAVLSSGKCKKRLVFSGHLDTYPAGRPDTWSVSPWSGTVKDEFLYGRGSADMKGGIACFLTAVRVLARHRDLWHGEIALALAGDEESMGDRGTAYLLDTVPEASGDAVICADTGAPTSLRFGQKGMLWIRLKAFGRSAHGAHLHKGENAIDKLIHLLPRIKLELEALSPAAPAWITRAILESAEISEESAGPGETEILQKVTVNYGTISGGTSPNLVADYAQAEADIRIPAGVTLEQITARLQSLLSEYEGMSLEILRAYEANWSDLSHPIFSIVRENSRRILKKPVTVTFRVGASDARLYRLKKQIPVINCGLTPYGLGGPDEHVSIDEMVQAAQIYLLSALDFLQS